MGKIKFDLGEYTNKDWISLSSRQSGKKVLESMKADGFDPLSEEVVIINIPDSIVTIAAEFFHEVFGESLKKYNDKKRFLDIYKFIHNNKIENRIDADINDAIDDILILNMRH